MKKIIDEMDLGYKNIIDSGQTLLSLVKTSYRINLYFIYKYL